MDPKEYRKVFREVGGLLRDLSKATSPIGVAGEHLSAVVDKFEAAYEAEINSTEALEREVSELTGAKPLEGVKQNGFSRTDDGTYPQELSDARNELQDEQLEMDKVLRWLRGRGVPPHEMVRRMLALIYSEYGGPADFLIDWLGDNDHPAWKRRTERS